MVKILVRGTGNTFKDLICPVNPVIMKSLNSISHLLVKKSFKKSNMYLIKFKRKLKQSRVETMTTSL
jgi:hypothetical protein